jgi:hypothetical protein
MEAASCARTGRGRRRLYHRNPLTLSSPLSTVFRDWQIGLRGFFPVLGMELAGLALALGALLWARVRRA